ncbi:MAG: hypothetical protein M1812_007311 [Candelaria pacifica]|nr:MAG: hypothetical protein M1812_007311 [Candelaria pacifica]
MVTASYDNDEQLGSGVQFGKYLNASHYDDGLFSEVFKAISSDGKVVALKLTTPSLMTAPHDSQREARILREAVSPHVIPLVDTFPLSGGRFILVLPFMPYDLERALRQKVVSLVQVKAHLYSMFTALAHIHDLGMIHRDIKPSNLLLASPSGPAFLADFGIAWSPRDRASESPGLKITDVGTTSYRPPELLFGYTAYGCALDLWAAGCVLAEAVQLGNTPLFDAGELGSELALIQSIFKSLGTPTTDTWPEAAMYPDWGKMDFRLFPQKAWSELLPNAPTSSRDLVSQLVRYESGDRLSAVDASEHSFFRA